MWGSTADRCFHCEIAPLGETICRDVQGYGPAQSRAESNRIDDALPEAEGFYTLNLLSVKSVDLRGERQDPDDAVMVHLPVDTTPPTEEPELDIREPRDAWWIACHYVPLEIETYELKVGKPNAVDCLDLEGFSAPRMGAPQPPKERGQYRVCVIALDRAGNRGSPRTWIVE